MAQCEGTDLVTAWTSEGFELRVDPNSLASPRSTRPIDLTTDGDSVLVIAPLPVAEAITWASRIIDDMQLGAHVTPQVVDRAVSKATRERFASATEMREALLAAIG